MGAKQKPYVTFGVAIFPSEPVTEQDEKHNCRWRVTAKLTCRGRELWSKEQWPVQWFSALEYAGAWLSQLVDLTRSLCHLTEHFPRVIRDGLREGEAGDG